MSAITFMTELMNELERVRALLRQREEELAKRMSAWNKLRDGYNESIAQLQAQLAEMTAERDEWQTKARWKHTHDDSLECELAKQLAAMTAELAQREAEIKSLHKVITALTSTERPPA